MNEEHGTKWLDKVYTATNNEELANGYDGWAKNYDQDVLRFGYKLPVIMAGYIGRYLNTTDTPILDAGAGTGILGETLKHLGYEEVVGIDLSRGMLDIAAEKGCYSTLRQMTLGEPLDLDDAMFAGILSSGVFTKGHAPPHSFDELLRICKAGGYLIFSARVDVYFNDGLSQKLASLESEGRWRPLARTEKFQALPFSEPEVTGQVFVYQTIG